MFIFSWSHKKVCLVVNTVRHVLGVKPVKVVVQSLVSDICKDDDSSQMCKYKVEHLFVFGEVHYFWSREF